MMKKRFRVMAALMAMAVMAGSLTGCGGNKNAPAETGSASSGTAAEGNSGGAAGSSEINAAKPAEGMALKEDIVIGMQSKHTTVDAMDASNTQHNYMYRMVYDTPVHFNNTTKELEPSLAEEWSTEDGGKTYIFKLRDGVKFHNGETLKASDFVFTFNRMEGTTSCNGVFLKVESVEAVDDLTVKMTLVDPNLPYMMTLPTASIMNEKAVTDDPEKGPAVGTGPWMVDSYEFGNYTKLVAFEDSWRGAPNAKSFTFRYIPEDSARLIALQNGEIDICQTPAAIELGRIEEDPALDLISYKGGSLTYMAFNTQKDPAKDENLRKAVAHAIDIDSIIAVAAEGRGEKATSFWGWDEFGFYDCGGYTRDLDKAKECLEAAGYSDSDGDGIVDKDGENLSLTISIANGSSTAVSETLQDMWKQIGVDVQIEMLENVSDKRASGDFDMLVSPNWQTVNAGDGQKYLMNRWSDGGSDNYSGYHSDEFQSVLDKLDAAFTQEDRVSAFVEAQQILADDAPAIWMYANDNVTLVNSKLENVTVFPIDYYLVTNKWTLAE